MISNILEADKCIRQLKESLSKLDTKTMTAVEMFHILAFRTDCVTILDEIDYIVESKEAKLSEIIKELNNE
ncbi:hypothetical protein [Helicobacter bilis]|uniref:hypothetical protein n=1 Tax=Helicobacter bilis TaxID=37372 RepID=UPI0025A960C5|nr:hypothetical protein [Helicobacter bilis]